MLLSQIEVFNYFFEVNNYKCPLCEMTCPNPSAVKHHMKYKHSNHRPFKCMYCDYTLVSLVLSIFMLCKYNRVAYQRKIL